MRDLIDAATVVERLARQREQEKEQHAAALARLVDQHTKDDDGVGEEDVVEEGDGLISARGPLSPEQARKRAEKVRKLDQRRRREQARHQNAMSDINDAGRDL